MTIDTATENKLHTQNTSVNEVLKPKYSGELRRRYEKVLPHVRRALYGVRNPKERKVKRNAAFVAADSLMQEVDPIIEAYKKDPLTELNTRQTFLEILNIEAQKAKLSGQNLKLLFIDLDGFKLVNDRLGHHVGDDVLRQVSEVIRNSIRPTDIAGRMEPEKEKDTPTNGHTARYGGDEFVILLPNTDDDGVKIVLDRLSKRVGQIPLQETLEKEGLNVTMSVGTENVNLDDPISSLKAADAAMYEEKKGKGSGRP